MDIKSRLYNFCESYVQQRTATIKEAIDAAKEAANDESKSSAGDKYETGRAMAQLDQEKNQQQLQETYELRNNLSKINPKTISDKVIPGSLVITTIGNFYIAIAAGKFEIDAKIYYAISSASPLGKGLMNHSKGDLIAFNQQNITLIDLI